MKNSKQIEKCSKNGIIFSSNLNHIFGLEKNWNLYFSISIKVIENLISFQKNINSESIGILISKLWPKYETDAEDNTNSALSSIFSQIFKWGSAITQTQHFPLLQKKYFWKINWIKKQIHPVKKIQKCSKDFTISSSNLKHIFGMDNVEIWLSLFLK